jgi:hypothetical protein
MPLTTVSPGLLDSNAQYYGYKNRIINGAMGIWQRGTSFTPSSVVFGADRFASYKAGAAAGDYARSTNVPSGQGFTYSAYLNNADLRQSIELPGAGLPGDFVVGSVWTLSFWCIAAASTTSNAGVGWADGVAAGSLNYWGGVGQNFTVPTTWTRISLTFTVTGTPTGSQPAVLVYISSLGANAYVTGVQLEKGSTATSFDYRPYGTELMLCQRYYETSYINSVYSFAGFARPDGAAFPVAVFAVEKRAAPTMTWLVNTGTLGGSTITTRGANTNLATTASNSFSYAYNASAEL